MSSSSNFARRVMLNVPSPNPDRATYARFIPREELGDVTAWSPGTFGGAPRPSMRPEAPQPPAEPAGPTPAELKALQDAARQQGYESGYRDGLAALEGFKQSHAQQMAAEVTRFVQSLDGEFDTLHARLAETVTRVAVQLARQVVRSELHIAPEHVAGVAAEAVEAVLMSARHITVQVNPKDMALVSEGAQEVLKARGARLVANAGVGRGGCKVDSDAGAIDAGIASRWAQVASALGCDEPWEDATEDGSE